MKPRTKRQVEVFGLSKQLLPVAEKSLKFVFDNAFQPIAYSSNVKYWCGKCGQTHERKLDKKEFIKCGSCGVRLMVVKSMKRKDLSRGCFAKAEIVGNYQVIRNFELSIYYSKGKPYTTFCYEILQHWILPGKDKLIDDRFREVIARTGLNLTGGSLEIRNKNGSGYYSKRLDVTPAIYTNCSVFKPGYIKRGIDRYLRRFSILEACEKVQFAPRFETLLKLRQYDLARCLYVKGQTYRYWPSIKIALKNKYKIKDASDWIDYLSDLENLGKDIRSPKWICPKNLHKAHQWSTRKVRERRERLDFERQLKDIASYEPEYKKHIEPYKDFIIQDGDLEIKPLLSVAEFKAEGDTLNHCVFARAYYKKKESLILSARISGKPIETIELYLSNLKISQSRGLNNNPTEYHDRIVKLVEKYKHKLRNKNVKPKSKRKQVA